MTGPLSFSISAEQEALVEVARGSTSRALHRFQRQLLGASPKVQRGLVGAEAARSVVMPDRRRRRTAATTACRGMVRCSPAAPDDRFGPLVFTA